MVMYLSVVNQIAYSGSSITRAAKPLCIWKDAPTHRDPASMKVTTCD